MFFLKTRLRACLSLKSGFFFKTRFLLILPPGAFLAKQE